jgi:dolichol-phosphate mannosyltransferase
LPLLRERLDKIRNRSAAWELLFVSDGSTDGSTRFIEAWASEDPSVKLIVLTRSFGHQSAVSAGLSFTSGNYIGIMDADLQDEPEVLLEMHRTLTEEKVDVVYAVRTSRRRNSNAFSISFFTGFIFIWLITLSRPTAAIFVSGVAERFASC